MVECFQGVTLGGAPARLKNLGNIPWVECFFFGAAKPERKHSHSTLLFSSTRRGGRRYGECLVGAETFLGGGPM